MSDQPDSSNPPDFSTSEKTKTPLSSTLIPPNWNYEATVAEIEAIISRIEMGELDLAEVFDQFATAVEHLRQCESFLTRQQQQVDLLIETLLDTPEPF
jgi:exodeoxyribonuclease VII small subunit